MKQQELLQAVYARLGGKPDSAPEPLILAKAQEAIKSVTKELVYSGNPMATELITTSRYEMPTFDEINYEDEGSGFFVIDLKNPVEEDAGLSVVKTSDKLKSVYMKLVGELNLDMGTYEVPNQIQVDLGGFINPAWINLDFGTFDNASILKNRKILEPCNSWDGLESLPFAHNKSYYKYHGNKLYIGLGMYDKIRKYEADKSEGGSSEIEVEHFHYLPLSKFPYELIDILLAALIPMLMPMAPQPEPSRNEGKKK